MPFYRITIYLKNQRKPKTGIRFYNQSNIDIATNQLSAKVYASYPPQSVVDVEIAMLSKNAFAVKKYQLYILKKSGKINE